MPSIAGQFANWLSMFQNVASRLNACDMKMRGFLSDITALQEEMGRITADAAITVASIDAAFTASPANPIIGICKQLSDETLAHHRSLEILATALTAAITNEIQKADAV